jgi:hypothetical protein
MKSILDWLQHNKEWVFSGVGIPTATGLFFMLRWIFRRARPNPPEPLLPRSPSLSVNLAFGELRYDGPPYLSDKMLIFTVANPSERPSQLTGIRLPLKDGANMVFPHLDGEKHLPCMIEPGTSSKFWVNLSEVEASIRSRGYTGSVKIHAVATDALSNDYTSNPVDVA